MLPFLHQSLILLFYQQFFVHFLAYKKGVHLGLLSLQVAVQAINDHIVACRANKKYPREKISTRYTKRKAQKYSMRAETLRTIASIASHAATLFHSKLSSACKKKSKRRKKKRMKERGKDGILEESFQSVFDAFQNEQPYEKFKKHVVTREVLSRRKSEIEETKGSQDSEEDLLDDWIVLEEESSEVDEGEKEEALKVAVVKVLVSAYEKIRRDEGENEIIK